jgi:alpha-glucosidase
MSWKDDYLWWQRGIIYQVYPRSFQDASGDGCGDLEGIRRRLDYLEWLGVDAVWISPFFPSPMKDFGYDIADYTDVDAIFGQMDDFDRLLEDAHGRGLRVILDLVPNHTSDQHPWFVESASSKESAKRDWYIWSDPGPDGGPPNNWVSEFAGSAWEFHEPTGQYYYHAFLAEQPDLNWRNDAVCEAMFDVMRFWLDKDVDGFRVDVMWHMIKDEHMRNNPPNPDYRPGEESPYDEYLPVYSADQPEVHDVVVGMRQVMDEYDERVMIGELYLPIDQLVTYYGEEESEAHLPFNFQLVGAPWDAAHIRSIVDRYEASLPEDGWPNWVLGNHDQSRIATRIGRAQARLAAMLLMTLRGTPTMYYGDELGMVDVDIAPDQVVDPRELRSPGMGLGRDPERTPMQWSADANAGFTDAEPWLPVGPDFETYNVERERDEPDSTLSLYRRLISLRQSEPALAVGDYWPVDAKPPLFGYVRCFEDEAFLVVLNFSGEPQTFRPDSRFAGADVVVSTVESDPQGRAVDGELELAADEGVIARLPHAPAEHPASTIEP